MQQIKGAFVAFAGKNALTFSLAALRGFGELGRSSFVKFCGKTIVKRAEGQSGERQRKRIHALLASTM